MQNEYRFKLPDYSGFSDQQLFNKLQYFIDSFDVVIAHNKRRLDQKFRIMALESIRVYVILQEFERRFPGLLEEAEHENSLNAVLKKLNIRRNESEN